MICDFLDRPEGLPSILGIINMRNFPAIDLEVAFTPRRDVDFQSVIVEQRKKIAERLLLFRQTMSGQFSIPTFLTSCSCPLWEHVLLNTRPVLIIWHRRRREVSSSNPIQRN